MISILHLDRPVDELRVRQLLAGLRIDPVQISLSRGQLAKASESVQKILADVAQRGDDAVVEQLAPV